jgi:hypothetical protein
MVLYNVKSSNKDGIKRPRTATIFLLFNHEYRKTNGLIERSQHNKRVVASDEEFFLLVCSIGGRKSGRQEGLAIFNPNGWIERFQRNKQVVASDENAFLLCCSIGGKESGGQSLAISNPMGGSNDFNGTNKWSHRTRMFFSLVLFFWWKGIRQTRFGDLQHHRCQRSFSNLS